ncbi:MAG: hypothetical protein ABIA63_00335 [bacterium]
MDKLIKILKGASASPKSSLEKFLNLKEIKLLAEIWTLENIRNYDLFLEILPYAVQANRIVRIVELFLKTLNGQKGLEADFELQLQRRGIRLETVLLGEIIKSQTNPTKPS